MMAWILTIYSSFQAAVCINETHSYYFGICLIALIKAVNTPQIFVITLESFLCTIRANRDIQDLPHLYAHHKVTAYIGNILFYI